MPNESHLSRHQTEIDRDNYLKKINNLLRERRILLTKEKLLDEEINHLRNGLRRICNHKYLDDRSAVKSFNECEICGEVI